MITNIAFRRIWTQPAISLGLVVMAGGCTGDSANATRNSARDAAPDSATPSTGNRPKQNAASAPARTGYADVEGGRIYYRTHGDLSSGSTPLLRLHGSFRSGESMAPFIDPFVTTRPVIAIDARGHGHTGDLPGPITHELMADDAVAVLTALSVATADVLGYSMGGTTVIFMAIRHPDRIGKQVIVSARLAILPATTHIGMMAEAERIAALAVPFLDEIVPPRATGFFKGMDTPPDSTGSTKK